MSNDENLKKNLNEGFQPPRENNNNKIKIDPKYLQHGYQPSLDTSGSQSTDVLPTGGIPIQRTKKEK